MKRLSLDYASMSKDYTREVIRACDELLDEYYEEIKFQMRTPKGKDGLSKAGTEEQGMIRRQIIGNAWAILDSFGSGSLMDKNNPDLQDYINSPLYNPLRREQGTTAILGRPAGEYEDIFGHRHTSSGARAGVNLEELKDKDGNAVIKPISPSYAFSQAWKQFTSGERIQKRLAEMNNRFFDTVRNGKYFRYG